MARIRTKIAALAACALLAAGALSACGGGSSSSGNGVESKSADAIVSDASDAAKGLQSVHAAGSIVDSGKRTALDLEMVAGKGARGKVSEGNLNFQIVAIGQDLYLKADAATWRRVAGDAAAQLLQDKWLKAPANSGDFASVARLTDLPGLLNALLSTHGKLAKGETSTVNGQKVVAVRDTTNGGTLYVATTGKPYPVQVTHGGSQEGSLSFDRYNESVSLAAPANAVDISQLTSG